ncbi:MAG: chemotaxis protein CheD [Chloroflexi bacterium]|nr:chemotaxis protein CheD [Chloroflexota bacterium]
MTNDVKAEVIGLGEYRISRDTSTILMCIGLGSCVSVCLYDSKQRMAGLAHVVLPVARGSAGRESKDAKYADTGVPRLIEEMCSMGARKLSLTAKISGGASLITAPGFSNRFNTGEENVLAVQRALEMQGIKLIGKDVGGHHGRTVKLVVATGAVMVLSAGKSLLEL